MGITQAIDATTIETKLFTQRNRLIRLCAQLTGDAMLAEDLAQETLLVAWQNSHQLRDPARWTQWLTGIARNLCHNWLRKQRTADRLVNTYDVDTPDAPADLADIPAAFDLEIELERHELALLLDRALAHLPPLTRTILIERYIHEAPQSEVARQLKISEGAVEARIHRGKLTLRRILTTELQAEAAAWGLGVAPAEQWQKTRLCCPSCGQHYLQGRFSQNGERILQLYCPCGANSCTRNVAGLFDGIQGYRAAMTRAAQWRHTYWQTGLQRGSLSCLGCGRTVAVQLANSPTLPALFADLAPALSDLYGAWAYCSHCHWWQQTDLQALAANFPAVQNFWRQQKRICILPIRQLDYEGAPALAVTFQKSTGAGQLDLYFHQQTLALLTMHPA